MITHGDAKYATGARLGDPAGSAGFGIERRRFAPGLQAELTLECTEVVVLLSGQTPVQRTGDGETQKILARPGMAFICPAGTHERDITIAAPMETLHLYLPPTLLATSALADYDLDPDKARLAYVGGVADPMLAQIGATLAGLLGRAPATTDRLLVDGMQAVLAAHLVQNFAVARWQPAPRTPTLDGRRLKRVLDFVEARLGGEITLDDLAAEACLSPFHFARLFREAIGLPPHRYVTERRVAAAKVKLALKASSLVEIALDTGFGTQGNFSRVFRKATGLTPGQFRELAGR